MSGMHISKKFYHHILIIALNYIIYIIMYVCTYVVVTSNFVLFTRKIFVLFTRKISKDLIKVSFEAEVCMYTVVLMYIINYGST